MNPSQKLWLAPLVILASGLGGASLSRGEVTHKSAHGFQITLQWNVAAAPADVYRALVEDVGQWWESSHTYSGDARNLSIDARAGGMFLEKLPEGGSVEHLRVVMVQPGRMIRFTGGLGPLQELGVSGALTCTLAPTPEGGATMKWQYNVSGETKGGLEIWAEPVNGVLQAQGQSLLKLLESR